MNKQNTNYVVVVDFEKGQTLRDCSLLGWNSKTDWFDCDTYGDEIMTPKGNVKKNHIGVIEVSKFVGVYVGNQISDCKEYADSATKEGYNCTICKVEKNEMENDWDLIPLKDKEIDIEEYGDI